MAQVIPVRLGAQADLDHNNQTHHHYKLIDVGTFGGPQNWVNGAFEGTAVVVSNAGTVVGGADTSNSDPNYPNVNPFLGSCFCSADIAVVRTGRRRGGQDDGQNRAYRRCQP